MRGACHPVYTTEGPEIIHRRFQGTSRGRRNGYPVFGMPFWQAMGTAMSRSNQQYYSDMSIRLSDNGLSQIGNFRVYGILLHPPDIRPVSLRSRVTAPLLRGALGRRPARCY